MSRICRLSATGWRCSSADHLDAPLIEAVLERASAITRGDPGKTSDVQVLAANIDTVFVVHPIAEPPNLRRIERELSAAWDSGAVPVVVLTKADLSADPDAARLAVEAVALGADVLAMNALAGEGIRPILGYISDHRTAVLVGPSGAGKSTLINSLLGEQRQATREVRVSDGSGMHTTVARELIQMPGGGVLIDTPGLRAFGLTGSEEGITSVFPEIERPRGPAVSATALTTTNRAAQSGLLSNQGRCRPSAWPAITNSWVRRSSRRRRRMRVSARRRSTSRGSPTRRLRTTTSGPITAERPPAKTRVPTLALARRSLPEWLAWSLRSHFKHTPGLRRRGQSSCWRSWSGSLLASGPPAA